MATVHITSAEEALDLICHRHYGPQTGAVEAVLEANPQIATIAHDLPAGTRVQLPDLDLRHSADQVLRLWD